MKRLRVAVAGTGYFSQFHLEAWRRIDEVERVAVASLDIESATKTGLPAFEDVHVMLKQTQPDVVDIITPPSTHAAILKQCIDHGIQTIICQKPFCTDLEEATQAVELCEARGILLVIHENFRFQPWYRVMRKALDEGRLGDVHQLTFRLRTGDGQGSLAYLDRQPYFRDMERFLIRETGVHWIDVFCYLMGTPKAIYADLRQLNPVLFGEDAGYFLMEFEGGRRALFDANRHLDHDAENCRMTLGEALLEGTRGTLTLSGSGEVMFRKFGSQDRKILLEARDWPGFCGDCVHALQAHVVDHLLHKRELENTGRDYLNVLRLTEAVYRSHETARKVFV